MRLTRPSLFLLGVAVVLGLLNLLQLEPDRAEALPALKIPRLICVLMFAKQRSRTSCN